MTPPDHGTRRTYHAGCRCTPCRAANAAYSRARTLAIAHGRWASLVPAQPVSAYLQTLSRHGLGSRQIARLAQVARITLRRLQSGQLTHVRARTAAALLAVTPHRAAHALVNGYPTRRQVRSLHEEGYPLDQLAVRLGLHPRTLQRHATRVACDDAGRPLTVRYTTAQTAAKVRQLYTLLTAEAPSPHVLSE